jgi:hypothetical protein
MPSTDLAAAGSAASDETRKLSAKAPTHRLFLMILSSCVLILL